MVNVFAQSLTLPDGTSITGPVTWAKSIGSIVSAAIPFIFGFAGLGMLIMLILGGFGILTSAGDAKKLEGAKQRLTYAVVGFIVIFLAFWIVQLAGTILGVGEIRTIFK